GHRSGGGVRVARRAGADRRRARHAGAVLAAARGVLSARRSGGRTRGAAPAGVLNIVKQRWALVLVGAWIAGSIWTSVVATQNFYTIDRLLAASPNASFSSVVQRLGQPEARDLLRYLSSELNRLYFRIWNVAQIGIAALTLWLIAGRTPREV